MMAQPSRSDEVPNLAAALAWAAQGLKVFPCHAAHKRPLTKHGFHDASAEPAQLRRWWAHWPTALVGLPTGAEQGRWVLDIDVRDAKGGDDSLYRLIQAHGDLPDTPLAITASGGFHYHFAWPAGRAVVTRTNVWPGIDVRGAGGYVIAPPSVGALGSWQWEASADPEEGLALAPAPDWLLAAVCASEAPPPRPASAVRAAANRVEVESALAVLDPDADYDTWIRIGMALQASGQPWAFEVWDAWSASGPSYPGPAELAKKWASFKPEGAAGRAAGLGTLFALAQAAGWSRPVTRSEGPIPESPPIDAYAEDLRPARPALRVVGGTEHDPRPLIQLRNGETPEAVDAAEAHLIALGAELFQHGTRLVRVGQWEWTDAPVDRPSGSGVLIDVSPAWLRDRLTRLMRWERWDGRKEDWRRVDCPGSIADTLLARVGEWRFPVLSGFCDSPTLDRAGRVVAAPGYDAASGLYLSRPPELPPMGVIDRHAAERAGETLLEAIETFPFVSEYDRSACLALIITALLRRVLPAAPIGCVSASTPGTGKSLLVGVISAIASGRRPAVTALGVTPEETEKRLDSVLLKGDALVSFDNVDRAVKSDVLCQVATEPVKSVRVMGLSKIVEAPTNLLVLMTGNNLTLVGDLVRRCVVVNLDAGVERPELREFERDAIGYVIERRAELIRAALVLSKAYLDAGCPRVEVPPFGSFEAWDRMVRRPLIWAGFPDPLKPAEAMREQDHELGGMCDLLRAWAEAIPHPVTAAELTDRIRERAEPAPGQWTFRDAPLSEAAIQVMGDLNRWGVRDLGYRLRSMAGRLFDGRRIVKQAGKAGARWSVEVVTRG